MVVLESRKFVKLLVLSVSLGTGWNREVPDGVP